RGPGGRPARRGPARRCGRCPPVRLSGGAAHGATAPGRACLARPPRQTRRRQQGLTFELDGPRRSADNQPRWREVVVRPDILVQQAQGSSTLRSGRLRAAGRLLTLVLAAGAVACGSDDNGGGDGGGGDG